MEMSWRRQARTPFSSTPALSARLAHCRRWLVAGPKSSRKKSKSVGALGILGRAGSSPIIALRVARAAGETASKRERYSGVPIVAKADLTTILSASCRSRVALSSAFQEVSFLSPIAALHLNRFALPQHFTERASPAVKPFAFAAAPAPGEVRQSHRGGGPQENSSDESLRLVLTVAGSAGPQASKNCKSCLRAPSSCQVRSRLMISISSPAASCRLPWALRRIARSNRAW